MADSAHSNGNHTARCIRRPGSPPGAILVGRVTLDRGASVLYGSVLRADDDEIIVGQDSQHPGPVLPARGPGRARRPGRGVSLGHGAIVHGRWSVTGTDRHQEPIVLGRARVGAGSLVAAARSSGPASRSRPGCGGPESPAGSCAS